MKNILSLMVLSFIFSSCQDQEVFTINCSKTSVLQIDSSIKHISKIKLGLDKACCDSIALVCVELNGKSSTDEEIIEIAKKHYNKIYLHKSNLEYKDDWYTSKFAIVLFSKSESCNQNVELKVTTIEY